MRVEVQRRRPATSAVAPACHAARLRKRRSEGFERIGPVEEFKSKMVSDVMQYKDVVAGKWYEADDRLSREALARHGGSGDGPVAERRTTGCVGDSWCSGAACTGQRAGVVSLGSGNSARASRMSRSTMLGAQRTA